MMRSLKMNGAGRSGGGVFKEVMLEGAHKITGDIDCENFHTAGTCKALGHISCLTFNGAGAMTLQGIKTKEMSVVGSCTCHGTVDGEVLQVEGYLSADEEINAEDIRIEGKFKVLGVMNAEKVTLLLHEPSSVMEIGAGKIEVRKLTKKSKSWNIFTMFKIKKVALEANLMEADEIYLEYGHVKKVCGDQVVIGPHCMIEEVEYRGEIDIHPTSKVKRQKQI